MIERGALFAAKVGILEAVRFQLALTDAGVPGRVCVLPGLEIAWDDCECGQLSVHHKALWPSQKFPQPLTEQSNCNAPWWVAEIVVTVLRCVPETDDESPPPCDELQATAERFDADAEAMQRGVICAMRNSTYQLGIHVPTQTEGLCGGSELPVAVGFKRCADTLECG